MRQELPVPTLGSHSDVFDSSLVERIKKYNETIRVIQHIEILLLLTLIIGLVLTVCLFVPIINVLAGIPWFLCLGVHGLCWYFFDQNKATLKEQRQMIDSLKNEAVFFRATHSSNEKA